MIGVYVEAAPDLDGSAAALDRLADAPRTRELWEALGEDIVAQARARIVRDKADPDGVAWAPWSDGYQGSGSLLFDSGELLDSLQAAPEADQLEVGSDLIYAGHHQRSRPFIGVGDRDALELERRVVDLLEGAL